MQHFIRGILLWLGTVLSTSGCMGIPWVMPDATAIDTVPAYEVTIGQVAPEPKMAVANRDTPRGAPAESVAEGRDDGAVTTASYPAPASPGKELLPEAHRTNQSVSSSEELSHQEDRKSEEPVLHQNALAVPKSDEVRSADDESWREPLAQAILALEARHGSPEADQDDATRRAVYLALLHLLADKTETFEQTISGAATEDQEFWKHYLAGLALYVDRERIPERERRAALALDELREAACHLAAASRLVVRNMAFCRSVDSFGVYTKFSDDQFKPDQEVLLYVEIDNFHSVRTPQGFVTSLEGSYQIFDAAGRRVADHTFPIEQETCLNRRRDYFIPYRMWMPKKIDPGTYTLQLTVQDSQAQKFGQSSIQFTITP